MRSEHHESRGLLIRGGKCLVAKEGLVDVDIRCRDGKIMEIGASLHPGYDEIVEARGCLVLPGMVDIHGDAFERQMMPRPNTLFPLDIAMLDTDRQLAANGITTAFHGITVSWEPGLRCLEQALAIIKSIDDNEAHSLVDHRVHIRWETFAIDQVDDVIALFLRSKNPCSLSTITPARPWLVPGQKSKSADQPTGRSWTSPPIWLCWIQPGSAEMWCLKPFPGSARRRAPMTLPCCPMTTGHPQSAKPTGKLGLVWRNFR